MTNFIIHGLARSRTAWLSEFLTYEDHRCSHEIAMKMRVPQDIKDYFSVPNLGSCETGAAQGWWLIEHACPGIKTVVIKRPVIEVVKSILDIDLQGVAVYDPDLLLRHMEYGDRILDRISKYPNVLTVNFHDLEKEETCKSIFEHCLPYKFNIDWWKYLKDKNIQVSVKDVITYYHQHKQEIETFKRLCKMYLRKLRKEEPDNLLWGHST